MPNYGLATPAARGPSTSSTKQPSESLDTLRMNLGSAANHLTVAAKTMRRAVEAGVLKALHPLAVGPWIFARSTLDDSEVRRHFDSVQRRGIPAGPNHGQLRLEISTT